jgi:hypothetical protein
MEGKIILRECATTIMKRHSRSSKLSRKSLITGKSVLNLKNLQTCAFLFALEAQIICNMMAVFWVVAPCSLVEVY